MLLEPLLHRDHGTFVCLRCRVRSVEDADFIEENNRDATSFALADFCTESDYRTCWMHFAAGGTASPLDALRSLV